MVSLLLLALTFAAGLVLALEPGRNAVDRWGFAVFSVRLQSLYLRGLSDLGIGEVTGSTAVVAALAAWRRDRRRALACLAGPALAGGLAETLKIVVGRRFEGALSWPSGTVSVVAAVATAVVLVTRSWGRVAAVVVGTAVVVANVVAVVAFRWHYLSDALGGVPTGIGCVLLVDSLLHLLSPRRRRAGRAAAGAAGGAGPDPSSGAEVGVGAERVE